MAWANSGARTFQRIKPAGDKIVAEYGFQNFNRDLLSVNYAVPRRALAEYVANFGYKKSDVAAIEEWHNNARQGAYNFAVKSGKGQAAVDAAMANLKAERDRKIKEYMSSRGFKVRNNVVTPDIPLIVRRNAPLVKPLAHAFDTISQQRRYGSEELIGAATSLVQTAMEYRIPPMKEGERHTNGLLPPVQALASGWGDCDSKTALLGSILANFPHMRMVGLAVPGHYLMGVLRIPGKGELFVEHQGLQYVLIEPAGPAWFPPGQVSRDTVALLSASEGYAIEPFF